MISVSLLASATGLPAFSAAIVGRKPTVPLVATTTTSTSASQAMSIRRSAPSAPVRHVRRGLNSRTWASKTARRARRDQGLHD